MHGGETLEAETKLYWESVSAARGALRAAPGSDVSEHYDDIAGIATHSESPGLRDHCRNALSDLEHHKPGLCGSPA